MSPYDITNNNGQRAQRRTSDTAGLRFSQSLGIVPPCQSVVDAIQFSTVSFSSRNNQNNRRAIINTADTNEDRFA